MKQLFVMAAAAAVIFLSSCRKDYTCTYKYDESGTSISGTSACLKCSKKDVDKVETGLKASGFTDVSCDKK